MPGLTRDRKEGEATVYGQPVTIVDTAGLEEAEKGSIAARMRAQTETAIETADLVLFVVDARAGITPTDRQFTRAVRSAGRPTILVANKSEGRAGRDGFYEAFELGLGEPVAISAEHGEGLGDLERDMAAALGIAVPAGTGGETVEVQPPKARPARQPTRHPTGRSVSTSSAVRMPASRPSSTR